MKYFIVILWLIISVGCTFSDNPTVNVIELQISKSTIPEGIVVHPETKEIFLSSVHEDRLTKSSSDGVIHQTILTNAENGYSIGVGIDIWQNKLYALGKLNRGSQSILTIKDLKTQKTSTFKALNIDTTYFNDLAIDNTGNCFITDTDNHKIYYFDKAAKQINVYLEDERIKYPNGITISDDGNKLFVDSYTTGIKIVEIPSKKILNQKHQSTTNIGIDGLKYHEGHLYYIRNGGQERKVHGLYKLKLNSDETELNEPEALLLNHEKMDLPTTISIAGNNIYILANSQLGNLNQETNEIKKIEKLTTTYILSLKIKDSD